MDGEPDRLKEEPDELPHHPRVPARHQHQK
jgi:hypothetical protein